MKFETFFFILNSPEGNSPEGNSPEELSLS